MREDIKPDNLYLQNLFSCLYSVSKSDGRKLGVKSSAPTEVVLVYLLCSLFFIPSRLLHYKNSSFNEEQMSGEFHYAYVFLIQKNKLESNRNKTQRKLKKHMRKHRDCYPTTKTTEPDEWWCERQFSVQSGSKSLNPDDNDVMHSTIGVKNLAVLGHSYPSISSLLQNDHKSINNRLLTQLDSCWLMNDIITAGVELRFPKSCQGVISHRPDDSSTENNNWIFQYLFHNRNKNWRLNYPDFMPKQGQLILSGETEISSFKLLFNHQLNSMISYNIDLLKIRQTLTSDSHHFAEIWKRHENLSRALAQFKACQIMHDLAGCEKTIAQISKFSKFECSLQFGVLLFAKGERDEAIFHLEGLYIFDSRTDIKRHLYLAKMFTAMDKPDLALHRLEEARSLVDKAKIEDMRVQIKREFATTLMCCKEYELALVHINHISQEIHSESREEKCCFYLTAAVCSRLVGKDSRPWLRKLQILLHQKKWPTMLRHFLNEVAFLHRENGLMPSHIDFTMAVNLFEVVKRNHPESCEWLLL